MIHMGGSPEPLIEAFRLAAFGQVDWAVALSQFASAADAHVGQIAAVGHTIPFHLHILAGIDQALEEDYFRSGGADPRINPRTRAVLEAPMMRCLTDEDFVTPDMQARLPIYNDLFRRYDMPSSCLVRLAHTANLQLAMALLRSKSRGHATPDQRRLIEAVAPALSDILVASIAMGTATNRFVVESAERLTGPALLVDRGLKLLSASAAADMLLMEGQYLTVRGGRLTAAGSSAAAALDQGFCAALAPCADGRGKTTVVLRASAGIAPLVVEIHALPKRLEGPLSLATALLIVRPRAESMPTPDADLLAAAFSMTQSEADLAVLLAQGLDLPSIAHRRNVALGTIRSQLKSVFEKTSTHRQPELVAKLRAYC